MAVSLITSFPSVVLNEVPIPIKITSSSYVQSIGSDSETQFIFENAPTDGDTMTVSWTDRDGVDQSVTMTCKTNPDESGYQFHDNDAGLSLSDYFQNILIPDWERNYLFARDFEFEYTTFVDGGVDHYIVRLKSRWNGDLGITNDSSSGVDDSVTNGSAPSYLTNYRILVDVYQEDVYDSDEYHPLLASLEKLPVQDGSSASATFFIHELLQNDKLEPELPDYGQTSFKEGSRALKRFFLKYAERYGDPAQVKKYSKSTVAVALRGKLEFPEHDGINTFSNNFRGSRFLTRQPDPKSVTPDQKEFLYWISAGGQTVSTINMELAATLYFDDNSNATYIIDSVPMSENKLYYVPAGFKQLNLDQQNASKKVVRYELYLKEQNVSGTISPKRTYIVDRSFHPNERHFLFENMLGGFDTLRTTGRQTDTFDVEKSIEKRPVDHQPDKEQGYYFVNKARGRNSYEVSTGYKSKEYLDYLRECLKSGHVYLIQEDNYLANYEQGGLFVPVIIEPDSFELYTDEDGIHALTFTYREAFDI